MKASITPDRIGKKAKLRMNIVDVDFSFDLSRLLSSTRIG